MQQPKKSEAIEAQVIKRLRAPVHQEPAQGLRGIEHLPAPAVEEQVQGIRGIEHLRSTSGGGAAARCEEDESMMPVLEEL